MTSDPPVRIEHFRSLMREAGVEEVVDEALRLFIAGAPEGWERLASAVQREDVEGVEMAAHALRSASLNIWAVDLARALDDVESAAERQDMDAARSLLGEVDSEIRRAVAYLKEQMGDGGSGPP